MSSATKKHITLVDDHVVVRNGLKALIEKLGPYQVASEFDNGKLLLDSLHEGLKTDLIVMDISMPELNGMQTMEQIKIGDYKTPVLMLTLNEDETNIIQLFRLGIRGYLKKDCSAQALKEALENILDYGYYHNEFLTYSLQNSHAPIKKSPQEDILEQLSSKEKEFLKLVCHEKEYTYQQMADIMNVQPRTVDGYRESIFDKFNIKSKTGLVLFVLKHQLMEVI